MQTRCLYSLANFILVILVLLQAPCALGGGEDFPLPERLVKRGNGAEYKQAAQDYLKAHPDSEFAPRVALDLLMLSKFNGDDAVANDIEELLLLDYIESMQGTYFISIFPKAEDYSSRLEKLADQYIKAPSDGYPKKYQRALVIGLKKFGHQLLSDNNFLLKSAIVVSSTGDTQLQQVLLDKFIESAENGSDKQLKAIASLGTDEAKPLTERILSLHSDSENTSAGLLRDLLFLRLTKDEKDTPAMRQINAESLLQKRRFQTALPILEKLPTEKDGDKILFQRLWCHAVAGDLQRVAYLQKRLDKDYPHSPWRERGHQLSYSVKNAAKNLGLYTDALRNVVGTAKKDFNELEATLSFENKGETKKNTIYLAYSSVSKFFEIQLHSGNDLLLAYKTTASDSMLFTGDEKKIRRFGQAGLFPSPNIEVLGNVSNALSLKAGMNFNQFGNENNSCLESPYLNDPEKIKALIQKALSNGGMLGEILESPSGNVYTLLWPNVLKPTIRELHIVVSGESRIAAVKFDAFDLHDVSYGPAYSFKFAQPSWPALPSITEKKFNPSYLFKVFGKLMELFTPQVASGQH